MLRSGLLGCAHKFAGSPMTISRVTVYSAAAYRRLADLTWSRARGRTPGAALPFIGLLIAVLGAGCGQSGRMLQRPELVVAVHWNLSDAETAGTCSAALTFSAVREGTGPMTASASSRTTRRLSAPIGALAPGSDTCVFFTTLAGNLSRGRWRVTVAAPQPGWETTCDIDLGGDPARIDSATFTIGKPDCIFLRGGTGS